MHVSNIERTGRGLKRYSPIQSARQLVSLLIAISATISVIVAFVFPFYGIGFIPYAIIGGITGGIAMLQLIVPRQFFIVTSDAHHFAAALLKVDAIIKSLGYRQKSMQGCHSRYETRQPGWLKWSENEFSVDTNNNVIHIHGPRFYIERLHAKIKSDANDLIQDGLANEER